MLVHQQPWTLSFKTPASGLTALSSLCLMLREGLFINVPFLYKIVTRTVMGSNPRAARFFFSKFYLYFFFFYLYSLFLILQLNVVCECPLVSYYSSAIFIGVKSFHHCNCAPAWFSASLMVARVKEVGAVHTKSLFRSPAVGDFYGTWIEIWAVFGLNGQLSCLHSFNQYIKLPYFRE